MAFRNEEDKKAYWRENLALLAKLLVVWFIVSFGAGIIFVDIYKIYIVIHSITYFCTAQISKFQVRIRSKYCHCFFSFSLFFCAHVFEGRSGKDNFSQS